MFAGKTKPHVFTWFIWGSGSLIVFLGQRMDGAGAGSWSNLIAGSICLSIAGYALLHDGRKYIAKSDWFFLGIAVASLLLYFLTEDWLLSIILISAGELFSFWPTVRKSRNEPYKETIAMYRINTGKFILMILATELYTFVTVGNSVLRLLMNGGFALFLFLRRRALEKNKNI